MVTHESALPCGCDAGARWICEQHRTPQSFGNCIGCDGYILALSEAPHCPSCARLKREADEETTDAR